MKLGLTVLATTLLTAFSLECCATGATPPNRELAEAVAQLIRVPGFPQVHDVQLKLRVALEEEQTTWGGAKTYKAAGNAWGIRLVDLSDPQNPRHDPRVFLSGTACLTPRGVADASALTLSHVLAPQWEGHVSETFSAAVPASRYISFPASGEDQCVTRFDLREYPPVPAG